MSVQKVGAQRHIRGTGQPANQYAWMVEVDGPGTYYIVPVKRVDGLRGAKPDREWDSPQLRAYDEGFDTALLALFGPEEHEE